MDLGDLYLVAERVAEGEARPVMDVWLLIDLDTVSGKCRADRIEAVDDQAQMLAADAWVDILLRQDVELIPVVADREPHDPRRVQR